MLIREFFHLTVSQRFIRSRTYRSYAALFAYDVKVGPSRKQKGCTAEIGHVIEFDYSSSSKA